MDNWYRTGNENSRPFRIARVARDHTPDLSSSIHIPWNTIDFVSRLKMLFGRGAEELTLQHSHPIGVPAKPAIVRRRDIQDTAVMLSYSVFKSLVDKNWCYVLLRIRFASTYCLLCRSFPKGWKGKRQTEDGALCKSRRCPVSINKLLFVGRENPTSNRNMALFMHFISGSLWIVVNRKYRKWRVLSTLCSSN